MTKTDSVLDELRGMVLDADATGQRGRSRALRAAIAALEAQGEKELGED